MGVKNRVAKSDQVVVHRKNEFKFFNNQRRIICIQQSYRVNGSYYAFGTATLNVCSAGGL